jgi:putative FmdB family regulatory protein
MPIYEYKCTRCGKQQEDLRSVKDRDVTVSCPNCRAPMARMFSAPAVHFKGAGWTGKGNTHNV